MTDTNICFYEINYKLLVFFHVLGRYGKSGFEWIQVQVWGDQPSTGRKKVSSLIRHCYILRPGTYAHLIIVCWFCVVHGVWFACSCTVLSWGFSVMKSDTIDLNQIARLCLCDCPKWRPYQWNKPRKSKNIKQNVDNMKPKSISWIWSWIPWSPNREEAIR